MSVRVRVTRQSVRYRDDDGKVHELKKGAVPDPELDEKHLKHWFIEAHVKDGNIVVLKAPDSVEIAIDDMTISQLKDAITAIQTDFDFSGCKKKPDYVEALKALKLEADK